MAGQGNNYPNQPDNLSGQEHGGYTQKSEISDEEMMMILMAHGYTVISPKSLGEIGDKSIRDKVSEILSILDSNESRTDALTDYIVRLITTS